MTTSLSLALVLCAFLSILTLIEAAPPPNRLGLNGDSCTDVTQCAARHRCVTISAHRTMNCASKHVSGNEGLQCICMSKHVHCSKDEPCEKGEECASFSNGFACVSARLAPPSAVQSTAPMNAAETAEIVASQSDEFEKENITGDIVAFANESSIEPEPIASAEAVVDGVRHHSHSKDIAHGHNGKSNEHNKTLSNGGTQHSKTNGSHSEHKEGSHSNSSHSASTTHSESSSKSKSKSESESHSGDGGSHSGEDTGINDGEVMGNSSQKACAEDSECPGGEACSERNNTRMCIATVGLQGTRVCIGVKHLRELQTHELLYKKHQIAEVLCDSNWSCATQGHIVRFRQESMMMMTYCERNGGCVVTRMHVNSPRYVRQKLISSSTRELQFTALAARFGSKWEEGILKFGVRMGL